MKKKLLKLFWSTLQISACTFGGGFVILALMRKKFVEELEWLGDEEMMDLAAIAQSSPGPIGVNGAVMVGYRVAGVPGALVAVAGAVLPPLVIISVISFFYSQFRDNRAVSVTMAGMLVGVAAVLVDVVIRMTAQLLKKRRVLPVLMLLASFAAVRFLGVNIILVILACGAVGGFTAWLERRKEAAP